MNLNGSNGASMLIQPSSAVGSQHSTATRALESSSGVQKVKKKVSESFKKNPNSKSIFHKETVTGTNKFDGSATGQLLDQLKIQYLDQPQPVELSQTKLVASGCEARPR